jgi:hypothetical protein
VKLIALGLLGVVLLSGMALAAAPLSDEDCVKMGAVVRSIGSLRDKGVSKADAMALSSRYSSEKVKHVCSGGWSFRRSTYTPTGLQERWKQR